MSDNREKMDVEIARRLSSPGWSGTLALAVERERSGRGIRRLHFTVAAISLALTTGFVLLADRFDDPTRSGAEARKRPMAIVRRHSQLRLLRVSLGSGGAGESRNRITAPRN